MIAKILRMCATIANKEMNKTILLKAQKRYENPIYKKLKKYEHYVTEDYLGTGSVSHEEAIDEALAEYRKFQVKTLSL